MEGDEHLDETLPASQVISGLVEDAVAESSTDEYTEEAIEEERLELLVLYLLMLIKTLHNQIGQQQADAPQQGVPADAEGAY